MSDGATIVAKAREWVDAKVRWRHQGFTRRGCDCIGLVGGVAFELGISDAWVTQASLRFKGYGRLPQAHLIYQACAEFLAPVPVVDAQPGHILLARFDAEPQHFAFMSSDRGDDCMIHALASNRRVVEHRIDDLWRSRIVCAYRFRGVVA